MERLKVPKLRTRVDFQMPTGEAATVAVYLSEFAHDHAGPERLSDLLNGGREFIPGHDLEHDRTVFISTRNVSVARMVLDIETDPDEQYTLPREAEIRVLLRDGQEVTGLLTYIRPEDRARVIDYLNEAPPFFPIVEKDHVALVNKHHVARIELLSGDSE